MICVDLFAGWGGFSLGAHWAGCEVALAANHHEIAVRAHALNHPTTAHVCQDLRQADWGALPPYDLLLAGPACPGHSPAGQPGRARSGRVRRAHDDMRATVWAVADCAEVTLPRAFVVENVPAFESWGSPGTRDGALFRHWLETFRLLGYRTHVGRLTASVHADVAQRRTRLFVVGFRGRLRRGEDRVLDLPANAREPAFGPLVERGAGGWRPVAAASRAVRDRVRRSRAALGGARSFLTQHTSDHYGVPLTEPIRTITTKDQWAIVRGDSYRPLTVREYARGQGFPDFYVWPEDVSRTEQIRGIGNAAPPDLVCRLLRRVVDIAS